MQAPEAQAQAQSGQSGHWVYTQQYGWVWMPYGDEYTSVPADGYGEPYEYVYYPSYGWTWVVAPWIWGWGPWPFFGAVGVAHFGWFHHGWWRTPWRWHFRPAWHGFGFHGARPFPGHGGFVGHGAPAWHSGHVGWSGSRGGWSGGHGGWSGGHGGWGGGHGGGGHGGHR
jgi:hypothetical protein